MKEKPLEVKIHDIHLDADYADWLRNVKARYHASQVKAAVKSIPSSFSIFPLN